MEFTETLRERLLKTSPAQIGHYIEGGYMSPEIKPLYTEAKMAGPAYTVRLLGEDSVTLYYAMERAPKGSVIVIDRGGDRTFACCGEIVAYAAKTLGMAGIVVDGPATDSVAIRQMRFPVFSRGLSAVTTRFLGTGGSYNIPVSCGGVPIRPGDIIFGDADGVISLTVEECYKYLEYAEADDLEEIEWREKMSRGIKVSELTNINRLTETDVRAYIGGLLKMEKNS